MIRSIETTPAEPDSFEFDEKLTVTVRPQPTPLDIRFEGGPERVPIDPIHPIDPIDPIDLSDINII
ncbi:hypothetical protein H7171_01110 [Candidatus Saccharibacteria bacterium]|nr:hypothetical protein [Candidatus Saccharibacteria bacterium]